MIKIKKRIPLIDQHDKNYFYGGKFGGNFVPETLKKPIDDLTILFNKLRNNSRFIKERDYYFKTFANCPTSLVKLYNLSHHLGGAQIYAKMVSECNGGAHKILGAIVHALICKHSGKKLIIGDTGAGFAGKMLSMAAKKFNLSCKIFMGTKDISRQKPNVDAIRANGAEIVPVDSGSKTLIDAVSECMRYWVSNCHNTHLAIGSTVGPNIFIKICGWSTSQISRELTVQVKQEFGKIPRKLKLINCIGGGSSSYGFWSSFMDYDKKKVELIGVESGGPKKVNCTQHHLLIIRKLVFCMVLLNMLCKIKRGKLVKQNLFRLDLTIVEKVLCIAFLKMQNVHATLQLLMRRHWLLINL